MRCVKAREARARASATSKTWMRREDRPGSVKTSSVVNRTSEATEPQHAMIMFIPVTMSIAAGAFGCRFDIEDSDLNSSVLPRSILEATAPQVASSDQIPCNARPWWLSATRRESERKKPILIGEGKQQW